MQMHQPHKNALVPRTAGAIALCPRAMNKVVIIS